MPVRLRPIAQGSVAAADDYLPRLHVNAAQYALRERSYGREEAGRAESIRGRFVVVAATTADLAAKLASLQADLDQVDPDVWVSLADPAAPEGRVVERRVDPAAHAQPVKIKWTLEDAGDLPLQRRVSFEAGVQEVDGSASEQPEAEKPAVSIDTPPSELQTAEDSGVFEGADAEARYQSRRGDFERAHPASGWVYSHKVTRPDGGRRVTYSLKAEQLRAAYPVAGDARVVEGDVTSGTESRGDALLATRTTTADLLLAAGDPEVLYAALRAAAAGPDDLIVSESRQVNQHRELRLRASFEVRASASGLVDWSQSLSLDDPRPTYEAVEFDGLDPILARRRKPVRKLAQGGQATGLTRFPVPPEPVYADVLLEVPSPRYDRVGLGECRTTWSYAMAAPADLDLLDLILALAVAPAADFYAPPPPPAEGGNP